MNKKKRKKKRPAYIHGNDCGGSRVYSNYCDYDYSWKHSILLSIILLQYLLPKNEILRIFKAGLDDNLRSFQGVLHDQASHIPSSHKHVFMNQFAGDHVNIYPDLPWVMC